MSVPRKNNTPNGQTRPLKPAVPTANSTRSPLTPRLAANATNTKAGLLSNNRAKAASATGRLATSVSPAPAVETPLSKLLCDSNITPRSISRNSRGGSAQSTPGAIDTPTRARAKSPLAQPAINGFTRSATIPRTTGTVSMVGGARERTTSPPIIRGQSYESRSVQAIDHVVQSKAPMFFHADDARPRDNAPSNAPLKAPTIKGAPAFVFANGSQAGDRASQLSPISPVLSAGSGRTAGPSLQTNGVPERVQSPPMLSPALSSVSAQSGYMSNMTTVSAQPLASPALSTPSGSYLPAKGSNSKAPGVVEGLRISPSPNAGAPPQVDVPVMRRSSLNVPSPRSAHAKSSSLSHIVASSPSPSRRRSRTLVEGDEGADKSASPRRGSLFGLTASPTSPRLNKTGATNFAENTDQTSNPAKKLAEVAAEARRERKVLDLEISNSSLLALNRMMERESKKMKAELKWYRRLSRSGRIPMTADSDVDKMPALEEEDLPAMDDDKDAVGRPSSPFDEDVSDMSSVVESSISAPLSPTAQADSDARHRAKDEAKLRQDLQKHREMLLDSQRMNQAIQRCLFWSEGLLKDGRKALEHRVQSADVQLGGRILSEEDDDAGAEEDEDESGDLSPDEGHAEQSPLDFGHGLDSMTPFLGLLPSDLGAKGPLSLESGRTERDSGVDVGVYAAKGDAATHAIDVGGVIPNGRMGLKRPP